jgi:MFS family permease
MLKASLIGAAVGFVYVMGLTLLLSSLCTLCFTPFLAAGAGYLAARFDRPTLPAISIKRGATAGVLAGGGMLLGLICATLVHGILLTHSPTMVSAMAPLARELGIENVFTNPDNYWELIFRTNSMCGLLNLMIMATAGAAGGRLWLRQQRFETRIL